MYLARKATPSIQSFLEYAFTNLPATVYRIPWFLEKVSLIKQVRKWYQEKNYILHINLSGSFPVLIPD